MADRRIVVFTGVTKGIGRASVPLFVERGHTVVGCGRSAGAIGELRSEFGAPNRFDVVDVSDDAAVAAWAADMIATVGVPDLLVNNAAVINQPARLWEVTAEEFAHVMDVNVDGVVNLIRHFAPAMVGRGSGVIVNLSSGWGRSTSPEVAPYCAAKWAVEGLTSALAQELPDGMAAIALNPGIINTEMLQSAWGDSAHQYATPEQWAATAVPMLLGFGPSNNGEKATVHIRR